MIRQNTIMVALSHEYKEQLSFKKFSRIINLLIIITCQLKNIMLNQSTLKSHISIYLKLSISNNFLLLRTNTITL